MTVTHQTSTLSVYDVAGGIAVVALGAPDTVAVASDVDCWAVVILKSAAIGTAVSADASGEPCTRLLLCC